ncbi:MAG: hypothetical protein H0T76_15795 [Nannocystis sp.]|nr:hypothetical protein [Nannocystis sp.]MBA3547946.1 hypothetical protein [Nannocystis sp.]
MGLRSVAAVLVIAALSACAGGEESTGKSGFASSVPTTTPPPDGSEGGTSSPTSSTGEMIRPDMGGMTAGSTDEVAGTTAVDPDTSTGVDPSASTGPATGSTTGPMIKCGDAMIEDVEECEGADLNGQDCVTLGFSSGALSCAANCTFDKSKCVSESCGDAIKNGGEECDCGQQGSPCTADQLGGQGCQNLVSPNGGSYHGGALICGSPASCTFNKTQCQYCGDGVRNGPEACEGADLGGQSCQGLGFNSGALKCSATCTHDSSACMSIVCGNGQCQAGEDSCNCPLDCADDPNSCSPCQCGGDGGNCYCDAACVNFGDCCFNGPC